MKSPEGGVRLTVAQAEHLYALMETDFRESIRAGAERTAIQQTQVWLVQLATAIQKAKMSQLMSDGWWNQVA